MKERFWQKVRTVDGECWEWLATRTKTGYGQFYNGRCMENAHRVSWFLTHGEIPEGLRVLHLCANRGCVNPEHLYLGTQAENVEDTISQGRAWWQVGKCSPTAKFTEAQVAEIRYRYASGETAPSLAREFCVHGTTIERMVAQKTYWESS